VKIKTSELTGVALDYAVAKCEGVPVDAPGYDWKIGHWAHQYSIDWAAAGVIIEREGIELKRGLVRPFVWAAFAYNNPTAHRCGPTALVAAMRCYVSSKLGDEVEIPNELIEE
jgi:hypothetical protein